MPQPLIPALAIAAWPTSASLALCPAVRLMPCLAGGRAVAAFAGKAAAG